MTVVNQGPIQQVPNELGVPDANNSNVVESAPVDTSVAPDEAPAEEAPAEEAPVEETPAQEESSEEAPAAEETPPAEEEELSLPTVEHLQALHAAQQYQSEDVEIDFVDEHGFFDAKKFQDFMVQNNQRVYSQAVEASKAYDQAGKAEEAAWSKVNQTYPEIEKYGLDAALRGARIQDLTAGGDGDLARLAKDLAAPFRQNAIDAVEKANKVVEEAESLETLKPTNATPPKQEPSLMSQLKSAVDSGDAEAATRIRHAIRKQRIYGTDK